MSGGLAMSGPPEDYTAQPCKKQRKDDDHSSKTITNYFSPVSKNVEKILSSPRSSNIADYFIRCSPVVDKECTPSRKIASPDRVPRFDTAKHSQTPQTPVSGTARATSRLTKQPKRTRLIKRLSDLGTKGGSNGDDGSDGPSTEVCGNTGFMGSETAALLAEVCSSSDALENDAVPKAAKPAFQAPPKSKSLKKNDHECAGDAISSPSESEGQQLSITSTNDLSDSKSAVGESSLEVHVDRVSSSLLTISFEDFVKSQAENNQSCSGSGSQEGALDASDIPNGSSDPELAQQPSPRTVTVQAEVHLSPPLLGSCSLTGATAKIASIFQKKKSEEVEKKVTHSSPGSDPLILKRRSNVVIEEEDLELAVIDVETLEPSKQKATAAERQQFMKAFRQAGDGSKPSCKKGVGKKKETNEVAEKQDNHDAGEEPSTKAGCEEPAEKKLKGKAKKLKRAVKKKQSVDSENPANQSTNEIGPNLEAQMETADDQETPVLRRSLRSQKSAAGLKSPSRAAADSPVLMSTPKVKTPSRKSDVYRAEMLTGPSDSESPIRMRFTRLTRRSSGWQSSAVSDDEAFTPGRKKLYSNSKKINKAKQLLEKAKMIQQNIAKAETPQRRSARQQNRMSQESIIIDEASNSPISKPKEVKKANLRSLNDVLGKKSKITPGQQKDIKKSIPTSAIITIDDGSDASENSQDDGQFKARREFLMSGLPDSLKKHIAKTAALREAYSVSCSSFSNVVHVQQKDESAKWNLTMPLCPLLTQLAPDFLELSDVTKLTLAKGEFSCCSKSLPLQQLPVLASRRSVFSEAIRSCLLEEIRWYNPQFPVRRFFNQFLKKQSDYLAIQENSKPGGQQLDTCLKLEGGIVESKESVQDALPGSKRKRKNSPVQNSKRRKPAKDEEQEVMASNKVDDPPTRASRRQLSRSSLRKSASSSDPDVVIVEEEKKVSDMQVTLLYQLDILKEWTKWGLTCTQYEKCVHIPSHVWEDVLWTEKYQPMSSSELIGNSAAIRRLHSWLKDWKVRADKEEKRNLKMAKDKNDTLELSDFRDSDDSDEESLCNTVLITGPPGVGKTAAVYACAQELGFKVFEVNASCQRSGRQILAQLKEATQSHQVDQQGVSAHKPCFFSNYSLGKSPRKLNSPKKVVSSPRKPPMSPRVLGGKKGLAPKSLANFFKAPSKQKTEDKNAETAKEKTCNKIVKPLHLTSNKEETQRKTATSLILFEEVDVIFDDDTGFLSAIKTFMSTTKRPVILTTSDPMFGEMFDGAFENITFHTPSVVNVASYLQVLCLAENVRTDRKDFITLLTASKCDIRQSMLQLQFWVRSGGGALQEKALPQAAGGHVEPSQTLAAMEDIGKTMTKMELEDLPWCNIGCVENIMGFSNIISSKESLVPFVKNAIFQTEGQNRIVQLLAEFQMREKDFIFGNLEFLLPLPLQVKESSSSPPCEIVELPVPPKQDCAPEEDDIKRSAHMRRKKKLVLLDDSDLFDSDSRSLDEILTLPVNMTPERPAVKNSPVLDEKPVKAPSCNPPMKRTFTAAEQRSLNLVYTCLDSMATLANNLSYVDCYTCDVADQDDACNLNWTESRLLHGLCDSLRLETRDASFSQTAGEIRGQIEALALHKCSSDLTKVLDSNLDLCRLSGADPTEQLTLPVSKPQTEVHFRWPSHAASTGEGQLSLVRSVLSNRAFSILGNRQANVTEYLPALRSICRIEKVKEEGKIKRRFLHYLEGIHLELPRATLNSLATDFP
ncbi:ATPase family AAA domain-containing protein 5 [Gastrophryne carolinensis]